MDNGPFGPPAYLVRADEVSVVFEAADRSWNVRLTREKWSEVDRPETLFLYAILGPVPRAD